MSNDNNSGSSSNQHQPATTWTEPPWSGWIETTGDALLILEAARRGLIPRVTRRLVDSERKMITSGSVFVFDEDESGIKRWTDGFFWSPSRILGNFLLYRETEKRGAGHRSTRVEREVVEPVPVDPDPKAESQALSRPKSESSRLGIDRQRERSLVGSLTNSYKFKPGGMMKKTFSLTIGGVAQHLISYYKIEDVEQGRLRAPSTLPELASLDISPEYLDKTHFRNPPKVEIGVDGVPRYRGEADDIDNSPTLIPAPLSSASLYGDEQSSSSSKRSKRYDPYGGTSSTPKRNRKKNIPTPSSPESTHPQSASQSQPLAVHPPASTAPYADSSLSTTTTSHYPAYGYYQMPGYHLPPVYSPAPYTGGVLPPTGSPGPQQSPSPPEQSQSSPTHTQQPPIPYAGYSAAESSSTSQSSVYPYYPPQSAPHGYASYPSMSWPNYSTYPPPHATNHSSGSQGSDDAGTSSRGGRSTGV